MIKALNIEIDNTIKSRYLAIAKAIRDAIKSGQLQGNEALPSARLLAEQLNVNRHTIMAAYQELIAEGWIASRQRKGYFVMDALPVETAIAVNNAKQSHSSFNWRIVNNPKGKETKPAIDCRYNFSGGAPDISLFPFKAFSGYINDAMSRPDIKSLNYGGNYGFEPFLAQIEVYLRRVRQLTGKTLVAVNGSQEALFLLSKVLLAPGDKVAVENLGYNPAWSAFRSSKATLIGINQDEQGIDPNHLELMAKTHQLRLIYLTPLHQYPTTVTLPIHRRLQVYAIAAKYGIPIVEDDYDHEFHYRCQPLAPMAADDPQQLVIYLSTFSKIMFPGVRLGFMALDKPLADAIVNYRLITNHKPNVVMQDAVARWMADGAFARHLRKLTRIYEQRRDHMVKCLTQLKQQGIDIEYKVPDGGMAMWVKTPFDAAKLAQQGLAKSIYIQTENDFYLNLPDSLNRYIRLGFSGMSENDAERGLKQLFMR